MNANVHTALWMTYLSRQSRQRPEDLGVSDLKPVAVLGDHLKHDDPMLGIALWNLLIVYGEKPPADYARLFRAVFPFDVADALEASRGKEAPVFPLDPQQVIQEPRMRMDGGLEATTCNIELCLAGDPDLYCDQVNPVTWSKCDLFWIDTVAAAGKGGNQVDGTLRIPDGRRLKVTLSVTRIEGPFEQRTDFEMAKNDRIDVCRGFVSVKKEAGRPGVVRIAQQRTVRFAPGFDSYQAPTLLYWLQAEVACIALKRALQRPGVRAAAARQATARRGAAKAAKPSAKPHTRTKKV